MLAWRNSGWNSMKHDRLGAAVIVLLVLPIAAHADDAWHGKLYCDALPGMTDYPLDIPFDIAQSGSALSYSRTIKGSSGGTSNGVESGTGMVTGTHAELTGSYSTGGGRGGSGATEAVHLAGEISGNVMRLTGEQIWTVRTSPAPLHRPCRARLTR
jgi:hypothetical protein